MEPVPSRYAPKEAHAKYMKLQCTSAAISSKRVEIDDTENEFASAAQVGKAGVRGFEAHAEWWFTGVKREDAQRKRRAAWGANPDEVANPDVPEDLLAAIKATSKVRREQREMQLDPQSSVASADARFGSRSMTVSEAGAVPANADGDVPLVLPSNEQDMMRTWGSAPPAVAGSDPANAEAGAGSAAVAQRSVAGDQGRPPSVAGSVSTPGRSEAGSKPSPSPVVDSSTTKRRKKVVSAEDKWSPLDDYNRTCRLSDGKCRAVASKLTQLFACGSHSRTLNLLAHTRCCRPEGPTRVVQADAAGARDGHRLDATWVARGAFARQVAGPAAKVAAGPAGPRGGQGSVDDQVVARVHHRRQAGDAAHARAQPRLPRRPGHDDGGAELRGGRSAGGQGRADAGQAQDLEGDRAQPGHPGTAGAGWEHCAVWCVSCRRVPLALASAD